MLKKIFYITIIGFLTFSSVMLNAQSVKPTVNASFSRDTILIGDQFTLDVIIEKDLAQFVGFPNLKEGLFGDTIEVLEMRSIDTIAIDGRRQTIKQSYLMTCFDEGGYMLGKFPISYSDKNIVDTLYSVDELVLIVNTFAIDTTKQSIADIKPQLKTPMNWAELKEYIFNVYTGIALIILILIVAIIYYIVKKRKYGSIFAPKPKEPAHIIAIKNLETLYNQKLWQNSKQKLYYSSLTDILRTYIDDRYAVNAMEMTSEEIIESLKPLGLHDKEYNDLIMLLRTADLVKFAKFIPIDDDNDTYYHSAYYFVENTKLLPQEIVVEDKTEEVK